MNPFLRTIDLDNSDRGRDREDRECMSSTKMQQITHQINIYLSLFPFETPGKMKTYKQTKKEKYSVNERYLHHLVQRKADG